MTPSPLSDLSRNLLAAARDGMGPDPAIAARVRAKVAASVGAPLAAVPVKATASSLGLKLAVVVGLVGLAATVWLVMPRGSVAPAAPQLAVRAADREQPTASVQLAASEPHAPAQSVADEPRAVRVVPAVTHQATATLAREVELVDRAMLALRRASPDAALAAIALYHSETRGRGQLAEDAAAIAIEAHCKLGHDARTALAAFDRTYPSSAQRARLADACR